MSRPKEKEEQAEFFVDRSLGKSIVEGLRDAGLTVHSMADIYGEKRAQLLADEVWLRDAGKNDWIVLTKDDAIRRRPAEEEQGEALGDIAVGIVDGVRLGLRKAAEGLGVAFLHLDPGLLGQLVDRLLSKAATRLSRAGPQAPGAVVGTLWSREGCRRRFSLSDHGELIVGLRLDQTARQPDDSGWYKVQRPSRSWPLHLVEAEI